MIPASLGKRIAQALVPPGPIKVIMILGVDYEVRPVKAGWYTIKKCNENVTTPYVVSSFSCTCPQFQRRGVVCKHMLKVREME